MLNLHYRVRIFLLMFALGLACVPFFNRLYEKWNEISIILPQTESASPLYVLPKTSDKLQFGGSHAPDKVTSDSTVYSIKFCELIRNSKKYDGKIVRIQTSYWQGIDTSALTDSKCEEWLRPSCKREDAPCEKIWKRVGFYNTRLDIVGRYTADIVDPEPNQNGYHVRLFEILELKSAKPERTRK